MKKFKITEQFKGLKKDDPGTWPMLPKMLVCLSILLGIVAGGFFLDTQTLLDELDAGHSTEQTLKQEYRDKLIKSVNLPLYKKQLDDVNEAFGSMLKQLPDKSNMESLITDINQAGVGRGLMFDLFKPSPTEDKKEFYAEMPIQLKVQGTYHQMGNFASDIANLSRIVTINDMSFSVNKDGRLQLEAVAKTFRYLDDKEIAEQKERDKKTRAASSAKKESER